MRTQNALPTLLLKKAVEITYHLETTESQSLQVSEQLSSRNDSFGGASVFRLMSYADGAFLIDRVSLHLLTKDFPRRMIHQVAVMINVGNKTTATSS